MDKSITEKLGMMRVRGELNDLYGQALVGTLLRTVAVALRDAALIVLALVAALVAADALLKAALGEPCAASCYVIKGAACCLSLTGLLIRLPVVVFVCYWAGFLSTKRRARSKFQHSALVSSLVILTLTAILTATPLPFWADAVFAVTVFVSLFQGYRRCFR